MRQLLAILLAIVIGTAFAYAANLPKADGNDLWTYISKTSPYQAWGTFPDHKGMHRGNAPHGPQHIVFVNDMARKADNAHYRYGSIIVKENYDMDTRLQAITVMYKVRGFDPSGNDWFWVKYAPGGKVEKEGAVKGCVDCHAGVKAKDYVFTHDAHAH